MPYSQEPHSPPAAQRLVEAARYALLRRLAFAMRHNMVVHLQPIGMITEVMERRLRAATPDLAQIHDGMSRISGFSRAAVESCLDVVTWLAPQPGVTAPLQDGVKDCLALVRSNFSFRGYALQDEVGGEPLPVDRAALRSVLPACLLALTDDVASPADIAVTATVEDGLGVVSVTVTSTQGSPGFPGDPPYRVLAWHEVEALAAADGVGIERDGQQVRLTFQRAG